MDFDSVYKTMLLNRGGNVINSDIKNSKDSINRKFKNDPSYRLGTLKTVQNNTEKEIDIRLVNNDNNPLKKKMVFRPNSNIDVGNYVTYKEKSKTKTHLVLSVEENLISPLANTQECNHLLKWMRNGQLYECLSVTTNATKYTEGTHSIVAGIVEIQARLSVDIPYNSVTKNIKIGQRFLINGTAWETTQTDYTTVQGLLTLTLGKSSINNETDNTELDIADYYTVKHDYKFDIPPNFNVTKDDSIKLVYSIQDNLKDIDYNLVQVEYIGNLIQVTKTEKDITIIGKELGTGSIKLKVNLTNETKEFNINFNVVQAIVNEIKYNVTTSNGYVYRIKEGSTLIATKYINGIADNSLIIDYQLDSIGQDLLNKQNISIIKKSDNSFTIRNVNINVLKTFTLTIVDKTNEGKILDSQTITLKSA